MHTKCSSRPRYCTLYVVRLIVIHFILSRSYLNQKSLFISFYTLYIFLIFLHAFFNFHALSSFSLICNFAKFAALSSAAVLRRRQVRAKGFQAIKSSHPIRNFDSNKWLEYRNREKNFLNVQKMFSFFFLIQCISRLSF